MNFFEKRAEEKGKELLIEEGVLDINPENIIKYESSKLVESKGNEKFEALAVVKDVPVSGYTKNRNGRCYPKELWTEVAKKKTAEGTLCMANHPKDEVDIEKTWGVWHNMKVNEDNVTADLYLIEEKPLKILKSGGSLGTSSVGYGSFEEDGETVKANEYELERLSDIVFQPSQDTYMTSSNLSENSPKTEKKEDISEEMPTNNKELIIDNNNKNNKGEVTRMDRLNEINHINHVKEAIRKAKSNTNLKEAIETLSGMEIEPTDLKKDVEKEISNLQEKLDEQREDALKSLSEKEKEYDELSEKYETASKVVDELKSRVERANQIMEALDIKDEDEVEKIKETVKKTEEEFSVMTENVKLMQEDIDTVSAIFEGEDFKELEIGKIGDIKDLVEDTKKRDADIEWLKNSLKEAEAHIAECEKELEAKGFEFEEEDLEEKGKKKKEQDDDEDEKKDDEKKDDDEDMKEKKKKKEQDDDEKKDDSDEKKDDEDDKDKEEKKEKKKEDVEDTEEKSALDKFVDGEIERNSSLKDIETELRESKSIDEAFTKIETYSDKSDSDDMVKMDESVEEKKVEKYVFKR